LYEAADHDKKIKGVADVAKTVKITASLLITRFHV
jgi:hypothetical protein